MTLVISKERNIFYCRWQLTILKLIILSLPIYCYSIVLQGRPVPWHEHAVYRGLLRRDGYLPLPCFQNVMGMLTSFVDSYIWNEQNVLADRCPQWIHEFHSDYLTRVKLVFWQLHLQSFKVFLYMYYKLEKWPLSFLS